MRTRVAFLAMMVLLAGAVLPVAAAAQAGGANTVVIDGMALPRDHRYEIYDEASQKYSQIQLDQVPRYARQGQRVYDRTGKAWVVDPHGKVNQRYLASGVSAEQWARAGGNGERWNRDDRGSWGRDWDRGDWGRGGRGGWDRTRGTVVAINGDEVTIREDGGRRVVVNMSQARTRLDRGLQVGDQISVAGMMTSENYIEARVVRERRNGEARDGQPGKSDGEWSRIHGRVQSVEGDTLRLRTDDGRMLTVDLSPVGRNIREALQPGEGVTVIGHEWTGRNQLRAEYVQQDSSDPSRGGAIAPSASPAGKR